MNNVKRIDLLREENMLLKKEIERYKANEDILKNEISEYKSNDMKIANEIRILKDQWRNELNKLHNKQECLDSLLDEVKAMKNVLKTGRIPFSFKVKRAIKNIKKI